MSNSRIATPLQVPALLRWCLHLLVAALLILVAVKAVDGGAPRSIWAIALAVLIGGVYAFGTNWVAVGKDARATTGWLALLLVPWVGLLILTPEAVYLAFAWFFILLHLLSRKVGVAAVVLTTIAAIAGFALHQPSFTIAMAIGPILGAAVVIATAWGYQTLQVESEQRRRLIDELNRTRAELAVVERESGVLAERSRIAREIHDTLAQGLSSIQLLLRAAGRSLDAEQPDIPRVADLVELARQTAQDNLIEARRVVKALAPKDLTRESIASALKRLCDTTSLRMGIPVVFHQEGATMSLPTPVDVALLRIAQSALANTMQHAQATRVDVTMTTIGTMVSLDIVDNGIGFDPTLPLPSPGLHGGFGLTSIGSRAREIGGTLTVESEQGQGTALAVSVDLANFEPANFEPANTDPTAADLTNVDLAELDRAEPPSLATDRDTT